jgi:hypothetical protein
VIRQRHSASLPAILRKSCGREAASPQFLTAFLTAI